MAKTAFEAGREGFTFPNSWTLDEYERQDLQETLVSYFLQRRTLGPLGPLVVPRVVRMVRPGLEKSLGQVFGLCGGMAFAALDFHRAGPPAPAEQKAAVSPAPGTPLRRYIWRRQLDSLVGDAARFVAWSVILNHVPSVGPIRGGTEALLARTRREWRRLKARLDAGDPVPIGLVRDVKEMFQNHQVLAVDYDEVDMSHGTIHVYDPNCPATESHIKLTFGERALEGWESCSPGGPPLRGFFCETYRPVDPRGVLG